MIHLGVPGGVGGRGEGAVNRIGVNFIALRILSISNKEGNGLPQECHRKMLRCTLCIILVFINDPLVPTQGDRRLHGDRRGGRSV